MNVSGVSFTCALALAGMVGAGATHWVAVNDQIARAKNQPLPQVAPAPMLAPVSKPVAAPQLPVLAQSQALELQNTLRAIQSDRGNTSISPVLEDKITRLLTHMESMDKSQQDMRDQMAETNRDLMELQFRVDTHSESFRPLRVTQDSPYANTPGVLPPRQKPE